MSAKEYGQEVVSVTMKCAGARACGFVIANGVIVGDNITLSGMREMWSYELREIANMIADRAAVIDKQPLYAAQVAIFLALYPEYVRMDGSKMVVDFSSN